MMHDSDDQPESLSWISELDFSMQPLCASTPNSSLSFSSEYSVISSLIPPDISLLSQSVSVVIMPLESWCDLDYDAVITYMACLYVH